MKKNRKIHSIIILSILLFCCTSIATATPSNSKFHATIENIPATIQQQMRKYTWHLGCPVSLTKLAYIKMTYWGFDQQTHQGVLIVNKKLAKQVVMIFKLLYQSHFPIANMLPMYKFKGNNIAAMQANNTSAFNCRWMTNRRGIYSRHSLGTAIDINPVINPYITKHGILPKAGKAYINRSKHHIGMITKNSKIYKIFSKYGWSWGGNWNNIKDYHHFEKRNIR